MMVMATVSWPEAATLIAMFAAMAVVASIASPWRRKAAESIKRGRCDMGFFIGAIVGAAAVATYGYFTGQETYVTVGAAQAFAYLMSGMFWTWSRR